MPVNNEPLSQYPDIFVYPEDTDPIAFTLLFQDAGVALDDPATTRNVSTSTFSATVYDDGVALGAMVVGMTEAAQGKVTLTLPADIRALMKRYSTWRLHETSVWSTCIVQGRFVKER